jgi:hypothetical protein
LGKRGQKPKFSDVACPNEEFEHYGITDQGHVVGPGSPGEAQLFSGMKMGCEVTDTLRKGEI